ncbi:TatD family hydrolase [bacterium]|nr:TatD family hydrolase [bacterium]
MPFIDTHCHLTWGTFNGKVGEVVERARNASVTRMMTLGTDLLTSQQSKHYADQYDEIYFAAGIHPNDASTAEEDHITALKTLYSHPKCVAVGEIGLDFYRDFTDPEVQDVWLRRQLQIAKEVNLPVVLHDRKASKELLRLLDEESYDGIHSAGGVFHCFAGDEKMADEVLARGFFISFTGNLTYKKSDRPEVAKHIPIEKLFLETDSPFMAPVPKRGRDNEPAYIPYLASFLAQLKEITLDNVARITTENALSLFGPKLKL